MSKSFRKYVLAGMILYLSFCQIFLSFIFHRILNAQRPGRVIATLMRFLKPRGLWYCTPSRLDTESESCNRRVVTVICCEASSVHPVPTIVVNFPG